MNGGTHFQTHSIKNNEDWKGTKRFWIFISAGRNLDLLKQKF
jgi:hypothetical protein